MDLNEVRKEIDACDKELVRLLEKRMDCVVQVAQYKLENNMEIFDGVREQKVLEKVAGLTQNKDYVPHMKDTYIGIMDASKQFQKKMIDQAHGQTQVPHRENKQGLTVTYQGIPGSYGEEAMQCYFGEGVNAYPCTRFDQVVEDVLSGKADYGVLPVENSTMGSVVTTVDLLAKNDLFIVGEYVLPICHNLAAVPGTKLEDIEKIYSHEQALMQCGAFLQQYPNWEQVSYVNTAVAAKMVADDGSKKKAVICSKRAAEIYGLEILKEGINGELQNSTRFAVFASKQEENPKANKISIMFALPHRSGTLLEAMQLITGRGLNLLKIESRPSHMVNWEYMFFIDFEGNPQEESCKAALADLRALTGTFKLLGSYVKDGKVI